MSEYFDRVNAAAVHHIPAILEQLAWLPNDVLKRASDDHPCPKCGSHSTIFSPDYPAVTGRLICRKCHPKPTGDVIATVAHWGGYSSQYEAAKAIADFLGLDGDFRLVPSKPLIEQLCERKGMRIDAFKRFGAVESTRRVGGKSETVVRVPFRNASGDIDGYYDMFANGEGKNSYGCKAGMFFPGCMPKPGETWLITEGVKDAAALVGLGHLAAGRPGATMPAGHAVLFRDTNVIVVPDLDTPGFNGANDTCAMLLGIARSVKYLRLPGKVRPSKGADVRDFLKAKSEAEGESTLRQEIERAKCWTPECQLSTGDSDDSSMVADDSSVKNTGKIKVSSVSSVSSPSIASETADPFPVDLLPKALRDYVVEGARSKATSQEMVATPLLATLAGCVGMSRRIAVKRDWVEPLIVWTVVIAESGSVKSPGLDLSSDLLRSIESEHAKNYSQAMESHNTECLVYERDLAGWKKSKSTEPPPEKPIGPISKRLRIDDTTLEAIAPILEENPKGLLCLTDELRGWFQGMGLYTKGNSGRDESRWLSLYGGREFSIDRKLNRQRIIIPYAAVSVTGTIQPSILQSVMGSEQVQSGLLARLLLVMPPKKPKQWTDDEIDQTTVNRMQRVVDRLEGLSMDMSGEYPKPIDIGITPSARNRLKHFINQHGMESYSRHGAIAAAWSKLEGYAIRLSLLIHLVKWASSGACETEIGLVDENSVSEGIELARWFAAETERVYESLAIARKIANTSGQSDTTSASRLIEWIASRGGEITERDAQRNLRCYRNSPEKLQADIASLIDSGRITKSVDGRSVKLKVATADSDDADNELKKPVFSELLSSQENQVSSPLTTEGRRTVTA